MSKVFGVRDQISPKGKVEVFVSKGKPTLSLGEKVVRTGRALELEKQGRIPPLYKSETISFKDGQLIDKQEIYNIIVNNGKDRVIESLTNGFVNIIARMAIGDRGAIPSDQTVFKVPTDDMDALYNEVFRSDLDATILDTGSEDTHEVKFIRTFSAIDPDLPITAFSNQAVPLVNEVALIMADLFTGDPLPRAAVASPATPPDDESMFSIRTFKSVPFDAANEIAITIRYTIFIE